MAAQGVSLSAGWYNLRGYIKPQAVGRLVRRSGGRITLFNGPYRGGATPLLAGSRDWTLVERQHLHVDRAGQNTVRIEGYRKPDGYLYFDDVALHRLIPPFVDGFVLYPNYRGALFSDRPQVIKVSVTTRPDVRGRTEGDFLVRLVLEDAGGSRIASVDRTLRGYTPTTISLDASEAPLGRYRLRLLALDGRTRAPIYEYPPYAIVKLSPSAKSQMSTYVDSDNALVMNGAKRFVLGIYDTSGRSARPSFYEPRISRIARSRINMYLNYWLGGASGEEIAALTTTLRKYGMSYLHTVNAWYGDHEQWPPSTPCEGTAAHTLGPQRYTACKARELGNMPGIAGWYTADERGASEAKRVFNQYGILRTQDLDGVTFIAQNRPGELGRWRDAADVIGVDPYPIYNIPLGERSPLEMVLSWVDTAQQNVRRSRPVWAVIQFFKHGSGGHWPTYDELRSMSYMAVVAGAKGLFYWSYGASALSWVEEPRQREEYWNRLVRVTHEIRGLERVLLAPDDPTVVRSSSESYRIRFIAKRFGGERYIIAVNRTSALVNAQFSLNEPARQAIVRAEDRTLSVANGSFRDVFRPYAAHVYRIPPLSSR